MINENWQVTIEIPHVFAQAVLHSALVYAMTGFEWNMVKFSWYFFFTFFSLCHFTFYGMMAVALTPNLHIASVVSSAFYGIWNLFSGFIIPRTVREKYCFFFYNFICNHNFDPPSLETTITSTFLTLNFNKLYI